LKRAFLLGILILVIAVSIAAQATSGIEFSIRYYDKAIYFPDSRIYVRAEIYNDSAETYRFKVSPERVFNVDFEIKTLSNEVLEHSEEFIIDKNSDQPVLYREYSLEPGERYAIVEDLTRYVSIGIPGVYVVKGFYHPELSISAASSNIASNSLTLSVQPGSSEMDPTIIIDRDTGDMLQQNSIPPDEVVDYMLKARQLGDWDKFFLYIDIEGLYLKDRGREESYKRRMSDAERRAALQSYRTSLTQTTTSDDLLLIPREFEIIKTTYTQTDASVLVIEKFAYPDYTEIKQYTYYLSKRDRIWVLDNYELKNLGTE
jgi:hypothetical protein